jgi:hypothetical protein
VTVHVDYAFYLRLCSQSISLELLSLLWSPGFLVTFLVTPAGLKTAAEWPAAGQIGRCVSRRGRVETWPRH